MESYPATSAGKYLFYIIGARFFNYASEPVPCTVAAGIWIMGHGFLTGSCRIFVLIPQLRLQSNITRVTKLYEVKNYYLFDFVLARGFFYHKIVEKCGLMSPLIHFWSKMYIAFSTGCLQVTPMTRPFEWYSN